MFDFSYLTLPAVIILMIFWFVWQRDRKFIKQFQYTGSIDARLVVGEGSIDFPLLSFITYKEYFVSK